MGATTIPDEWLRVCGSDYHIPRHGVDELPVGTFLVWALIGTAGRPSKVARIVRPNNPAHYPPRNLTDKGRLLYCFFRQDRARKVLLATDGPATDRFVRYIVMPGDPRFEMLDAFKIICDTKRAGASGPVDVNPRLLHDALSWQFPPQP